jgi:hypothetical protein
MSDMDDDDFDLSVERPMSPIDLVIAVWCLLGCIVEAFSAFFNHVATILVAHRNYQSGQREFADTIRADIENIPTTEEA